MTIRCEKGHYYDGDRFAVCPYCAPAGKNEMENDMTIPVMDSIDFSALTMPSPTDADIFTASAGSSSTLTSPIDDEVTIASSFAQPSQISGIVPPPMPAPSPVMPTPPSVQPPASFPSNPFGASFGGSTTIPSSFPGGEDEVTVRWSPAGTNSEPTVGWLIGVSEGDYFGECFALKNGRNFIGRGSDMDVVLAADPSISRSRHAVVIYEPHGMVFIAQPGDARELFYVNNDVVLGNVKLKPYDILIVGQTKLMFFPLCGPEFSWEDVDEED